MSAQEEKLLRQLVKSKLKLLINAKKPKETEKIIREITKTVSVPTPVLDQSTLTEILGELQKEKATPDHSKQILFDILLELQREKPSLDKQTLTEILLEIKKDTTVSDKLIDELQRLFNKGGPFRGGSGPNAVQIKNIADVKIDPSTEQKQDDTITAIEQSKNYYSKVLRGNITGQSTKAMAANNPDVNPGAEESIWSQGDILKLLTTDTTLFISSSSAGDTGITFLVTGYDDTFNPASRLVTSDGQNQVALNADIMIVNGLQPFTSTTGDIYIAESDTLTGGVPDTASKIQLKMIAGRGAGFNAIEVIPAGKTGEFFEVSGSINKGKDANVFIRFIVLGITDPIYSPPFNSFEGTFDFNQVMGTILPEKTIIDFRVTTADTNTSVTVGAKIINEDNA